MPGQKLIPFEGVDLNNNELYINQSKSPFLKNVTFDLNRNGKPGSQNVGVFTPVEGSELYCNTGFLPAGNNFCIGTFAAKEINQTIVFVYNSLGNHLIYRLLGSNCSCEKISQDSCWNFQLNPKHFISEGRCTVQTVTRWNKLLDKQEQISFVVFTDYFNPTRSFVSEDLIATGSYSATLFPFFNVVDKDCYRCDWYNLGVPTPTGCIEITPVKRNMNDPEEKVRPNLLAFKPWQFRNQHINIYGQDSEHGVISTQYVGSTGNSCIENSSGLPRCLRLKFGAGCPLIEKIQVEFKNCSGTVRGFAESDEWFLHTVIEKYKNCDPKNWWEREINNPWKDEYDFQIQAGKTILEATAIADSKGLLKYNHSDNTFEYTFCADKECTSIPYQQTNRLQNPLALIAGNVFSLNKNIALARLTKDFEPIDCAELDKIKIKVTPPAASPASCKSKLITITVWGLIWNPYENEVQRLRRLESRVVFGKANCNEKDQLLSLLGGLVGYFLTEHSNNPLSYEQLLPVDQEGIIGYLAGTPHYSISTQYRYNSVNGQTYNDGLEFNSTASNNTEFALQKWEFKVPAGNYLFRISGHQSTPNDDYQKTSTYFAGMTQLGNLGNIIDNRKEIFINACNGDVEIKDTPALIYDFTHLGKGCLIADASAVVNGYLYEDQIDNRPISLARVRPNKAVIASSEFTDHNGFFFASTLHNNLSVDLISWRDCTLSNVAHTSDTSNAPFSKHFVKEDLYVFKNKEAFRPMDQVLIKGKVVLCSDANIGVGGALVILRQGQFAFTDNNGEFTIVAHDRGNGDQRVDDVIFSQRGSCILLGCGNNCVYCFPSQQVVFPGCNNTIRTITLTTLTVRIKGLNSYGPTMGGRYGVGIVVKDWLGRETNIQIREKHYIDIPTLQATQEFDYSKISFEIEPSFTLPAHFRKLSFYITENLNQDDFLTWVAERVQFIDNTGKPNIAAPTQIRLYYEGLGEYNKQNNFATNSTWQFIKDGDAAVIGDQVEILANGDGTIYTKKIVGLVKYDKTGKYVSIDYTDELRGLKDGALIRLIRPKQCQNKQFFYELCPIIRLINGKPEIIIGDIPFADSYLLSRQIPVPIETVVKTKDADGNEIQTSSSINQLRTFPFFFEHHSPSDFWGDHCYSKGRINVKNPYENQHVLNSAIQLSKALANNGVLNGLHYFDDSDQVILNEQEWGGITGVVAAVHWLLIIFEQNNCTLGYDDGTLRQRADGTIGTTGAEGRFGKPERKAGSTFGCSINDVSTIRSYNGSVFFVDRSKSALVVHNFSEAKDVSVNSFKPLMKSKVRMVLQNSLKYLFGIIDPKRKEYLLTTQDLFLQGKTITNDADDVTYGTNQTIGVDILLHTFKSLYSFIPEYYGTLESDLSDEQLIAFVNGRPHKLHSTNAPYCNFFGIQCRPRLSGVGNMDNTKEKSFMALEVYCVGVDMQAYKVKTGSGQLSRIREGWFDKRATMQCAAFLCDLNTRVDPNIPLQTGANRLLDGNTLYGRWVSFYLAPRDADLGKYFEYTAAIVNINGVEKSSNG